MSIFLILAPYGVFASLMLVTSALMSVLAAATVCLAVILLDAARGRSVKILGAGSAVLFAGIGGYLALIDPALAGSKVKLAVDAGIFTISAGSILIRYPFTLQYALESVHPETAAMPGFLRANYMITGAWTAATLLMMLSNLAMLYVPGLPIWTSLVIAFAARNSAVYFTKWYPSYRKLKHSTPPAEALPTAH
ncbi:hypothetical protein [Bradyrhizobium sp. ARR65]|uniref:hypothetical protein n=1 Tax=Bradyrhizobium sp. ARR65 TaxID=1040989 RepID=UPI0004661809|nr:hypothetical protein [Bradyrhizobium sp. ARR65]